MQKEAIDIRESVKNVYDMIAENYSKDFGVFIEDLDIYQEFANNLSKNAKILDLGAGPGRTYSYYKKLGYDYIGLDFSKKMRDCAYQIHGHFSYVVDDMVNIKKCFANESIDAVFAVYSLFHLPNEDLRKLFFDIYDILKINGIFLFTYQIGNGEEMADEPYLKEKGKHIMYMNYKSDEEIKELLDSCQFEIIFRKEKVETSEYSINNNAITTEFVIAKKIKKEGND